MNRTVVLEHSGLTSGYPLSVHKTTHIKLMFHFRRYHQYRDPRPHPPRTARALWQDSADQRDEGRNEGQMGGKREQDRRAGQLQSRESHYPGACFRLGCPLAPWLLHTPKGPRPGARAAEESGICKEHRAEWPARRVSPGCTPQPRASPAPCAAPAGPVPGKPRSRGCFWQTEGPLSAGPTLPGKLQHLEPGTLVSPLAQQRHLGDSHV